MWIAHREEIRKLTFQATLLAGGWYWSIKQQNELVEWKAFIDTVRIKGADLKKKFLL